MQKSCGNINITLVDVADLKNKFICKKHFMPKDIIIGSKRKLLSKNAGRFIYKRVSRDLETFSCQMYVEWKNMDSIAEYIQGV